MNITAFFKWLESFDLSTAIREGESLFPWLESIHVLAIVLVVGSIVTVDLRLLGWASRERAVSRVTAEVLPITWIAFAAAVITGVLMFCAKATTYGPNVFFLLKMGFLAMAGCNMAFFHKFTNRNVEDWGAENPATPQGAKVAGAVSLVLWVCIVVFGRWIGFTM